MKYIIFYRENNNFDDILKDVTLKKHIDEKFRWEQHLRIGIRDNESIFSYITLKYGDEMRNAIFKDYAPKPNIDYIPVKF
jgi:hypothetical protein